MRAFLLSIKSNSLKYHLARTKKKPSDEGFKYDRD